MNKQKILKGTIAGVVALAVMLTCLFVSTFANTGADKEYTPVKNAGYLSLEGYDYSLPVRESTQSDISFFNDAVFLGDSRAVDLVIYSPVSKTRALPYCDIGLNVTTVFKKLFVSYDGIKITAMDALYKNRKKWNKVYIMFGINELGYDSPESFIKEYEKVVSRVRKINRNAQIYVHSILPVSKEKATSSDIYTNKKIQKFNKYIKKMCKSKRLFYLDAYEEFSNNEGNLPYSAASDGVHFNSDYCEKWLSYLLRHTVKVKSTKKG